MLEFPKADVQLLPAKALRERSYLARAVRKMKQAYRAAYLVVAVPSQRDAARLTGEMLSIGGVRVQPKGARLYRSLGGKPHVRDMRHQMTRAALTGWGVALIKVPDPSDHWALLQTIRRAT